jgi:hypothetical protein
MELLPHRLRSKVRDGNRLARVSVPPRNMIATGFALAMATITEHGMAQPEPVAPSVMSTVTIHAIQTFTHGPAVFLSPTQTRSPAFVVKRITSVIKSRCKTVGKR